MESEWGYAENKTNCSMYINVMCVTIQTFSTINIILNQC